MEYISSSLEDTFEIAQKISSSLQGGDIIALFGDLGAGKTTLTKGIAAGLGIEKDITSPTFTLMNIYPVSLPDSPIQQLVHIDTYRMENAQELLDIGVEDYLGAPDTLTVIEWPEKIDSLLNGKHVKKIYLVHEGENKRKITFE